MDAITLSDEIVQAYQRCKDLKTCTTDNIVKPLAAHKPEALMGISGKMELLLLAQFMYYAHTLGDLSVKHAVNVEPFTKLMDAIMRVPANKASKVVPKEKSNEEDEEDASSSPRRRQAATAR